jgi:magnesium chelatase family protein
VTRSGYELPGGGYALNLASDLPAAGAGHLDLAAAVALLAASGQVPAERTRGWMLIGELGFDGQVRPVRETILFAATAKEEGFAGIIVPEANAAEAAAIAGLDVRCAETLGEVVKFLSGEGTLRTAERRDGIQPEMPHGDADMADVKGQEHVKRALEVAAAGATTPS